MTHQEFAGTSSGHKPLVTQILHFLYDADILMEGPILRWYRSPPTRGRGDDSDDDDEEGAQLHGEIRKQVGVWVVGGMGSGDNYVKFVVTKS